MLKFWRQILVLIVVCLATLPAWAERRAEHVFIISFDGGKPAVMKESKMPELNSLLESGAYTWNARTIFPSITLTAHTSMLTGLSPEKHHVLWNDWEPQRGMVTVPTVFSLAKEKKLTTAMFVGKPKFIHLYLKDSLNQFSIPSYHCDIVAREAAAYIKDRKPNLCFIHFADSDGAGHAHGWGSTQQIQSFNDEDKALETVMHAISDAGIANTSVVIMTADHGGHDHTHGSHSAEDMVIPWIVWGEGVKKNYQIAEPVTTYDTAATALWLLDVPLPANLDGKPVTAAFSNSSVPISKVPDAQESTSANPVAASH